MDKKFQDISNVLRRDVAIMTTNAGSGHVSSCFSCSEIISCLFFHEMAWDPHNFDNPDSDEFILSKGHVAPILYSVLFRAGAIKDDLNGLRKLHSNLEGHPMPKSLSWTKVATGSLGQGLSIGIGMALASKIEKRKNRVFVLLGDSEISEGSVWEAFSLAGYYRLNNLIAIIDVNRLGQTRETQLGHNINGYKKRIEVFGWDTIEIDGHNIRQILKALSKSGRTKKPVCIIAKTIKGKGVSFIEDKENWHGKVLDERHLTQALNEIPHSNMPQISIKKPLKSKIKKFKIGKIRQNFYKLGDMMATREAFGNALLSLAKDEKVLSIDAETSDSTRAEKIKEHNKNQAIECFIAEQNMIGIALGLSKKGFKPFASTFAAFLTRAHDQIRMAALSNANFTIVGSHAGVSIGQDGASQMGLEDIAMFRTIPNSTILYPSDAVSCEKIMKLAYKNKGITYIRTTRPKTPVIYNNNESFQIGGFNILKESNKDKLVIIGSGITIHESLKAYYELIKKRINVSIIDLYCIKPLNEKKLYEFIKKHGKKIILVEDHYKEGGMGEAIINAVKNHDFQIKHLYVGDIPHSGKPEELLKKYRIDSEAIIKAVIEF
ncbi:MAG: transketolase [Candidatus Pacearchaeota archaeon]